VFTSGFQGKLPSNSPTGYEPKLAQTFAGSWTLNSFSRTFRFLHEHCNEVTVILQVYVSVGGWFVITTPMDLPVLTTHLRSVVHKWHWSHFIIIIEKSLVHVFLRYRGEVLFRSHCSGHKVFISSSCLLRLLYTRFGDGLVCEGPPRWFAISGGMEKRKWFPQYIWG